MIQWGNKEHGFKIADAIPRQFDPYHDVVLSRVTPEGNLMGGIIYEGYISNAIFMHQASFDARWLTGNMIWMAFDFPFNKLGVGKVVGTINSANKELLAFNERLGFKEEARIKDAYTDGDLVIMTMERSACRWLNIKPKIYEAANE